MERHRELFDRCLVVTGRRSVMQNKVQQVYSPHWARPNLLPGGVQRGRPCLDFRSNIGLGPLGRGRLWDDVLTGVLAARFPEFRGGTGSGAAQVLSEKET